jgi:hypothetical protein
MVGSGAPANLIDLRTGQPNVRLLSVLNVRYVIWPVQRLGGFPVGDAVAASSLDGRTAYEAVYEIPTLPRARLVGEAVVIPEEEAVGYLLSSLFRPDAEVVLPREPPVALPGGAVDGEVQWLERGTNRMRLRVQADDTALLVLADNWFPAWRARVGGEEAPVLRANHTLRAVPVPAGTSEVEIWFDAGTLNGPLFISVGSLLLLALLGGLSYRKRGREAAEGPETGLSEPETGPRPPAGAPSGPGGALPTADGGPGKGP